MRDSFLIDTDIIIYWLKGSHPQLNEKFGDNNIFISSISVAELYFGAYNSMRMDENLKLVKELTSEINILNFDQNAGEYFGKIKASLKSKGQIIDDSDLFIAATAISNELILVTNNEKHFQRIENLNIQNWIQ